MLFSEPKIPQLVRQIGENERSRAFQCSSASRKFLNWSMSALCCNCSCSFSALQRAENSSMRPTVWMFAQRPSFSALQRAENSSIRGALAAGLGAPGFQCSSASRKFLNRSNARACRNVLGGFSALQRAENSSILGWHLLVLSRRLVSVLFSEPKIPQCHISPAPRGPILEFQCSSASRKFLNTRPSFSRRSLRRCFSALQRAENSSMRRSASPAPPQARVSVLFSEPKIPQSRPSHLRPSIFPTATITLRRS